jgi:galactokinase
MLSWAGAIPMAHLPDLRIEFRRAFRSGGEIRVLSVPGRVNLIGEHIDYHGLPVLPIAIRRCIRLAYRARSDRKIRAVSSGPYGPREFEWTKDLGPAPAGDWQNYLRAAARAVGDKWAIGAGIDAIVRSDLPAAAGLSSSSALLVAFTLALLRVNGYAPTFEELMEVLPEGEHFVGTRGGGMDHAAVLASRKGCASLIAFDPVSVRPIPIPAGWGFLVAHTMDAAEKSGGVREEYNARRRAGTAALERLGFASYRAAIEGRTAEELVSLAVARLADEAERNAFLHVTGEALRVRAAVSAMERADARGFGMLLNQSHESLRDLLKVSCPSLDRLAGAAIESLAAGARLTGAGFGGCVVVFCGKRQRATMRRKLIERYYSQRPGFDEERHLIDADPAPGVLCQENHAASYD